MKKLIFVDNDRITESAEDLSNVESFLEIHGGLSELETSTIEIVSDFHNLTKEEAYKILFSPENCICTWSMYTANHYGSLQQLFSFLISAGRNRIENMIYLDTSGQIQKTLERNYEFSKTAENLLYLFQAIETNYIISTDISEGVCFRLRLDLKGMGMGIFKREEVNLNELLNN